MATESFPLKPLILADSASVPTEEEPLQTENSHFRAKLPSDSGLSPKSAAALLLLWWSRDGENSWVRLDCLDYTRQGQLSPRAFFFPLLLKQ